MGISVYGTMIPLAVQIRQACEKESIAAGHPEDVQLTAWRVGVNMGSTVLAGIIQSPLVYAWDKRKAEQGQFSKMSLKTARQIAIKKGPGYMKNLKELYIDIGCVRGAVGGVALILADQAYRALQKHSAEKM